MYNFSSLEHLQHNRQIKLWGAGEEQRAA